MALSLEQDGQELVDDTDSAPSRGRRAISGCVNSVNFDAVGLLSPRRGSLLYLLVPREIATYNANLAI